MGMLSAERLELRLEFRKMEQWDDFVVMSNRILDDDLMAVVSARPGSLSYSSDIEEMDTFLQKYFTQANLMVVFPEQSGKNEDVMSFIDPTGAEVINSPAWPRRISNMLNLLLHPRKRKKKIE